MGKRKNLFQFLGERLNDKQLMERGQDLKLEDVIINTVPKRNAKPLTNLSIQNDLEAILHISKNSKLGAEKKKKVVKAVTKSAKKKSVAKKVAKKKVAKKVTKVSKTKTKKRK